MNPDQEQPPQLRECPECEGSGVVYPFEPMLRCCCPTCGGDCVVPVDAAEGTQAAAETKWESARDK